MLFCLPAVYYLVVALRHHLMRPRHRRGRRCAASSSSGRPARSAPRRSTSSRSHRDDYEVVALAAGRNAELLAAQAAEFGVAADAARALRRRRPTCSPSSPRIPTPTSCSTRSSASPGCPATLAALEHGKRLALANKESLIAGGPVVAKARAAGGGEIVPVDSEHSAVYQCLRAGRADRGRSASCSPRAADRSAAAPRAELAARSRVDRRARAPDLEHGRQDHDRLVDADEQGPRGDRGARAVRRRLRPRSTSSCTRSRSCTAWSSSSTARRSRSSRCPTCACRSGSPSARPARLARGVRRRSTGPTLGSSRSRRPTSTTFPCLRLAYEAGRAGGTAPGGAERRQRGRGRGLPRRPHRVDGDRRDRRRSARRRHRERPMRSPTFSRPTAVARERATRRRRATEPRADEGSVRGRRASSRRARPSLGISLPSSSLVVAARARVPDAAARRRDDRARAHRDDHAARVGHFITAKRVGHEGHRVLRRLRAAPLVVPARRDRVRRQGASRSAATAASSA